MFHPFLSSHRLHRINMPADCWALFFVTAIIYAIPKIGSANVFALVIAGQLFFALLYDHFGFLGFPQNGISWVKVLGVLLMITGAYLINKK